jgi:hypothetical protein
MQMKDGRESIAPPVFPTVQVMSDVAPLPVSVPVQLWLEAPRTLVTTQTGSDANGGEKLIVYAPVPVRVTLEIPGVDVAATQGEAVQSEEVLAQRSNRSCPALLVPTDPTMNGMAAVVSNARTQ